VAILPAVRVVFAQKEKMELDSAYVIQDMLAHFVSILMQTLALDMEQHREMDHVYAMYLA